MNKDFLEGLLDIDFASFVLEGIECSSFSFMYFIGFRRFLRVFHSICFLRLVLRNLFLLEGLESMTITGAICVILVVRII